MQLETYNGKASGIVSRNCSTAEDICKELISRGRIQASMIIPEIIGILKDVLVPFKTEVCQSVGLLASGTTLKKKEMALIKFNTIELNASIKDIRKRSALDIFKKENTLEIVNNSNKLIDKVAHSKVSDDEIIDHEVDDMDVEMDDEEDSSYEEKVKPILGTADFTNKPIRIANFSLLKATNNLQTYHVAGFALPLDQSMTVNISPKGNDKYFRLKFKKDSNLRRIQLYVPALRNQETHADYFNMRIDEDNIFDIGSSKKSLERFNKFSRNRVDELRNPKFKLGARCEVTSKVRQPSDGIMTPKLIREGLFCLVSDVNTIHNTTSEGYCASSIVQKISLGIDGIVGLGTALFEMVGTPSLVKKSSRLDTLVEFGELLLQLRTLIASFWRGSIRMNGSNSYAPCLSICAGRNLITPYCYGIQELLKEKLQGKRESIYANLKIEEDSVELCKLMQKNRIFFDDPLRLLNIFKDTSNKNSIDYDRTHICMVCHQLFSSGNMESEEIKLHPCRPIRDDVRDKDVIGIHNNRVSVYIRNSIDSLTPDQSNILSATVAKKSVIIVAAAGSGKTHVLKLINVIYRRYLNPFSVIMTAMFNIIATSINGKTFHSFLKLGCATAATVGRYIYDENSDLNDFVTECYKDPKDFERLEHMRRAEIMIIDEVIFNSCFLCY
jgi:hypothetical protein